MRTSLPALGILFLLALGCQGDISTKPPVHLNPNMDWQKRFMEQAENPFFADDRAMRLPVEGTVATDELKLDDHYFRGKQVKVPKQKMVGGKLVWVPAQGVVEYEDVRTLPSVDDKGRPLLVDQAFLERGQQRFGIYCSVCHGLAGDGDGINVIKGFVTPPAFWEDRLIGAPIGHFFNVITNGQGNMPAYAAQIPVRDRWAISAYVRTLQRRKNVALEQIPAAEARAKGWSTKP